jgi:hypothetical protein
MGYLHFGRTRTCWLLSVLLVTIGLLCAGGNARAEDQIAVVTVLTKPVGGSPGSEPQPKPASARETSAKARVNPCPLSGYGSPNGTLIDNGPQGKGYYQTYTCSKETGWVSVFVCVLDCPEGAVQPFIPPTPPSLEEVYISIHRVIPTPDLRFAPPIENGGKIAAVVGKRLYATLTQNTFEEKDGAYSWDNGYWYADILMVPDNYTFTDGNQTSGKCTDSVANIRTAQGRKAMDQQHCFIVINNRPANSKLPVTVTTHWHAIVTTNIPGVAQFQPLENAITYQVPVKELQAVIIR